MSDQIISSTTAYATPADMLIRYDKRLIGRLVSDTGTPVTDDFALNNNIVLRTLLKEASGIVESYAFKGGRYTREMLQQLYNSNTSGRELLVSLVCAITLYLLWRRRGDPNIQPPKDYVIAEQYLRQLERGANIFAFLGTEEAGYNVDMFSHNIFWGQSIVGLDIMRLTGNVPLRLGLGPNSFFYMW